MATNKYGLTIGDRLVELVQGMERQRESLDARIFLVEKLRVWLDNNDISKDENAMTALKMLIDQFYIKVCSNISV